MSTPQKNLNNDEKCDDSAWSKQAKQSSSTPQTNESSLIENEEQKASSSYVKSVTDEEKPKLERNFVAQNHQELFINKCLNDFKQEKDDGQNDFYEAVVKATISELQAKLKDVGDLSNLSSLKEEIETVVAEIKEKIELCDTYTDVLQQDYSSVNEYITKKMEKINQVNANSNVIIQKSIDQQLFFDRESQILVERILKLDEEIYDESTKNDKMAVRCAVANILCNNLIKTKKKYEERKAVCKQYYIKKKSKELKKSNEALAANNDKIKKRINEKKGTIKKLDKEKIQLQKKKSILLAGWNNAKEKFENLCEQKDELTKKTADQEKDIARENAANKILLEDKTAKLEFQQKHSQLSIKLKKITEENAKMQRSVDEKQQQWDNLKRLQENILKKQQDYKELQLKVAALKKENADSSAKISITNYGCRLFSESMKDDPEEMDVISDSSSSDLSDFELSELDSDFDFDFDSFHGL